VIVIDASVLIEVLLDRSQALALLKRELAGREHEPLHAPAVIEPETLNVLRKFVLRRIVSPRRATEAVSDLTKARLIRYPHEPLVFRIWELRDQLTAFDAAYVALAEVLGAEARLLTEDKGLARVAVNVLGRDRVPRLA
jgi:predicted nucleic acid-binding protein